jgi:hypothetical protein
MEWILYFLMGMSTNVNSANHYWNMYCPSRDYTIVVKREQVEGFNRVWFGPPADQLNPWGLPARFTFDNYPRFQVAVLEGGKYIEIDGLILERPANLELTLREWYANLVQRPMPAGLESLKSRIENYRGGI